MALQDAMWQGRVNEQVRQHERRLGVHDHRLDDVEDNIGTLREQAAAHRARIGLISGICAILGSGIGAALIDLLTRGGHS